MSALSWICAMFFVLAGCAPLFGPAPGGRTVLIDGESGLENFVRIGGANWVATAGGIQAGPDSAGPGFLVSTASYSDFRLRVEFWASHDANSGVFLRCQDPVTITDENSYEANIFDQRPDPTFGTGAIVKLASVKTPHPKAGGRWNTYDITAQGGRLVLILNGQTTVDITDGKFARGPIALQWARGLIKFRRVEIRPL